MNVEADVPFEYRGENGIVPLPAAVLRQCVTRVLHVCYPCAGVIREWVVSTCQISAAGAFRSSRAGKQPQCFGRRQNVAARACLTGRLLFGRF